MRMLVSLLASAVRQKPELSTAEIWPLTLPLHFHFELIPTASAHERLPAGLAKLAAADVRRISLATSLYRAAMTGFLDAVNEVRGAGQFGFLDRCVTTSELMKLMGS